MSRELPPLDAAALLSALNRRDVEYVVIGGFAMMAHDATRATKNVAQPDAPRISSTSNASNETVLNR